MSLFLYMILWVERRCIINMVKKVCIILVLVLNFSLFVYLSISVVLKNNKLRKDYSYIEKLDSDIKRLEEDCLDIDDKNTKREELQNKYTSLEEENTVLKEKSDKLEGDSLYYDDMVKKIKNKIKNYNG